MNNAVSRESAGHVLDGGTDPGGLPWEALADAARRYELATVLGRAGRMSPEEVHDAQQAAERLARVALVGSGWRAPEDLPARGDDLNGSAEAARRLAWKLAETEDECARVRDTLASRAVEGEASAARRCHQLVETALLFGAIELAATLGVEDGALPG